MPCQVRRLSIRSLINSLRYLPHGTFLYPDRDRYLRESCMTPYKFSESLAGDPRPLGPTEYISFVTGDTYTAFNHDN